MWLALAGVVALHIIFAALLFDPKPYTGGDNAGYLILAESLQTGQGYRDLYLPDMPRHSQYPPFYPALLAAAGALGGGLIAFKILSILLTVASIVLLFGIARKRLGVAAAFAVAVPFALSPPLLFFSHWVLSEAPFVALTLAALWMAERQDERAVWLAGAIGLGLLAYMTRAAGLPLLVAFLVTLGWRREWRRALPAAVAIVFVIGGWWLWGKLAAPGAAGQYGSNFLLVNPYAPEQGYVGPGDLMVRCVENVRLYAVEVLPRALAGQRTEGAISLLALLTSVLLLALAALAWARRARRPGTLEAFTLFYAALIALWPQVWTSERFLLPLLPVLLLYAAEGVGWCFEFMKKTPAWAFPIFGGLLALLAMPNDVRLGLENRVCMNLYSQGDRLACYVPAWRAFVQTADWVRENTAEDAIVITRKPRLFYYFGRRRGDVYPFTSDDAQMLGWLDEIGADYVVVAGLSGTTMRYLVPVIRSQQERFALAHQIGDRSGAAFVLIYRPGAELTPGAQGQGRGRGRGRGS